MKARILPNIKNKAKWYYGWITGTEDRTGDIIHIYDIDSKWFPNCYSLNKNGGTLWIEKTDVEIINEKL